MAIDPAGDRDQLPPATIGGNALPQRIAGYTRIGSKAGRPAQRVVCRKVAYNESGTVAPVWGSVLGLALLGNLNPVRLGIILLLFSRPRPTQNLIAFWVGCLMGTFLYLAVPLTVLHFTPMLNSVTDGLGGAGTDSTVGRFQTGLGVFALSVAVLMTVRLRRKQPAELPTESDDPPVFDRDMPTVISRHSQPAPKPAAKIKSALQWPRDAARDAWKKGALWISWAIGFGMGPAPEMVVFALLIILTSGATIGMQISAALVYAVVMLVLVEAVLVSCLVIPEKTEVVLRRLRGWTVAHQQKILIAVVVLAGVWALTSGMSRA